MKRLFAGWCIVLLGGALALGGQPVRLAPAESPVDNPLKGLVPYAFRGSVDRFPHSLEFSYIPLSDLMRGPAKFDWTRLESFLNGVAGRGNQAVFRVWVEYPDSPSGVPRFLVDQGLKITRWTDRKPDPPTKNFTPDYSDEKLVSALETFVAELGRRYDRDPRVGFITAGLLGMWGEWHDDSRKDLFATRSVQARVMTAYQKAFSQTPILLRYPASKEDRAYAPNASSPFGYHDDSFAWGTIWNGSRRDRWFFLARMQTAGSEALEKWKTHPIGGEIRPELWGEIFDEKPQNPHAQDFAECVRQTHVTWLMDTGMFREPASQARRERAIRLVRRMGYDFRVETAEISRTSPGRLSVALQVMNQGIAPFYRDWALELGALSNDGNVLRTWPVDWKLTGLLPGDPPRTWRASVDGATIPSGARIVAIRAVNPLRGGKALRFANADQDRHARGWLSIGTLSPAR